MSSGVPLLCREDEEGLREVLGRHPAVIGLKLLSCSGLIAANERQSVISGVGWVVVSPGGEVCQMASHPPPPCIGSNHAASCCSTSSSSAPAGALTANSRQFCAD
jgi:hypothetical protein